MAITVAQTTKGGNATATTKRNWQPILPSTGATAGDLYLGVFTLKDATNTAATLVASSSGWTATRYGSSSQQAVFLIWGVNGVADPNPSFSVSDGSNDLASWVIHRLTGATTVGSGISVAYQYGNSTVTHGYPALSPPAGSAEYEWFIFDVPGNDFSEGYAPPSAPSGWSNYTKWGYADGSGDSLLITSANKNATQATQASGSWPSCTNGGNYGCITVSVAANPGVQKPTSDAVTSAGSAQIVQIPADAPTASESAKITTSDGDSGTVVEAATVTILPQEPISASDSVKTAPNVADSADLDEGIEANLGIGKTVSDSTFSAETAQIGTLKSVSDGFSAADQILPLGIIGSEPLTVADLSITRLSRFVADGIGTSESGGRREDVYTSDVITASEGIRIGFPEGVSEAFSASEAVKVLVRAPETALTVDAAYTRPRKLIGERVYYVQSESRRFVVPDES